MVSSADLKKFQAIVLSHWKKYGRHDLPWRKMTDPYKILVSEVMLQQTQVERVMPYYRAFLREFPTVRALARAPLSDVLRAWSGLGYNRRAKLLHDTARAVVAECEGVFPRDLVALMALPGIGPYTAGAIRAFAFNEPGVFIETNIRTVILHHAELLHLSDGRHSTGTVRDGEIAEILEKAARGQDPRTWYSAMMDYGAHLKKSGVRLNHKSAHYAKQSTFEGSLRQVRGAILRALSGGPKTTVQLRRQVGKYISLSDIAQRLELAGVSLERDGLIERAGAHWRIHEGHA